MAEPSANVVEHIRVEWVLDHPNRSQFLADNNDLDYLRMSRQYMLADLAKSGLTWQDMEADGLGFPFWGWRQEMLPHIAGNYAFPYYDLDGRRVETAFGHLRMFRVRGFLSERAGRAEQRNFYKYTQPTRGLVGDYANAPYIHPDFWALEADRVCIAEGEKKSRAMMKYLGLPTMGTGGCWNHRAGPETQELHPMILAALRKRGIQRVDLVPDADVRRYDISPAYEERARLLREAGFEVALVDIETLGRTAKIDDLLWGWGPDALARYDSIPRIDVMELRETGTTLARQFNLIPGQRDNPVALCDDNVGVLMEQHPSMAGAIRMNLDSMAIEVRGEPLVEAKHPYDLLRHFQRQLSMPMLKMTMIERAMAWVADRHAYSPFRGYVSGLVWDGEKRLDGWLRAYCGAEGDAWVDVAGMKWLVGAVARAFKPGCKMDWMLIAKGAQGIGKSSLPTVLWPDAGMVTNLVGTAEGKDMTMLLHQGLCINFEELDSFHNKELEALKALISNTHDSVRLPYARTVARMARRGVLYGTTNRDQMIKPDASGYRRFVIVEMKQVQFAELERDRDQLWAEAYARWESGEVDISQMIMPRAEVERYVMDNPCEYHIRVWLSVQLKRWYSYKGEEWAAYTSSEVVEGALREKRIPHSQQGVAAALRSLGFVKLQGTEVERKRNPWVMLRSEFEEAFDLAKY